MKLLLDENVSFRILNSLLSIFPESTHVSKDGLIKSDGEIFQYAKRNDFTILTFDEDFYDLQLIKGFPPKIIWLRVGNMSNLNLLNKIISKKSEIEAFEINSEVGILEIY
jgi:predicted nuclease of predicted toxin-antitoxin system